MVRSPRWVEVAQWGLVLAMFVLGLATWPVAPDRIPVHWNAAGQVDRYGGKIEGLFLLPAIALVVALGLEYLPAIDPRRERYAEFAGAYAAIRVAVTVVLAGVYLVMVLWARGVPVPVGLVVAPLVGLLLVVIGLAMGRIRPNWFFGIRTPWTLTSERSWRATHHASRPVFVVMGVAVAVAGLLQAGWVFGLAAVICVAGAVGLVAYSYVVWRDDPARRAA